MLQTLIRPPIKNWLTIASFSFSALQMKDGPDTGQPAQPKSVHVRKEQNQCMSGRKMSTASYEPQRAP
jgi:hypothetical protein